LYAIGMEHPPTGEKSAGSYVATIGANGEPIVLERDRSLAVSGIMAVANQIAILGYNPSEHKSTAVFRMINSVGKVLWQHLEDSSHWNFPFGVIKLRGGYLLASFEKDFSPSPDQSTLTLTAVSTEGKPIKQQKYGLAIQPSNGLPRNLVTRPSGNIAIAFSGNLLRAPPISKAILVNPQTASRRFCRVPDATQILEVNPETLDLAANKVLENLSIVALNAAGTSILAAGQFTSDCRLEKRIRIVELNVNYEPKTIFESSNINSIEVRDLETTAGGNLLLGGRVWTFLPTALTFSLPPASQIGSSQFDPWSESFWDSNEQRPAAFILMMSRDGDVFGDKVIADLRGRGIAAMLPGPNGEYVAFGSAFGDRGWIAGIRLPERISTSPIAAPQ
jgi:hypothetical protein